MKKDRRKLKNCAAEDSHRARPSSFSYGDVFRWLQSFGPHERLRALLNIAHAINDEDFLALFREHWPFADGTRKVLDEALGEGV